MDKNGNRTYLLDDFPDEPFSEDQVGENFVFSICKRYFGVELDSADDLLFETAGNINANFEEYARRHFGKPYALPTI